MRDTWEYIAEQHAYHIFSFCSWSSCDWLSWPSCVKYLNLSLIMFSKCYKLWMCTHSISSNILDMYSNFSTLSSMNSLKRSLDHLISKILSHCWIHWTIYKSTSKQLSKKTVFIFFYFVEIVQIKQWNNNSYWNKIQMNALSESITISSTRSFFLLS